MGYRFYECWTTFSDDTQQYIARSAYEARQALAQKLGCPVVEVMGRAIRSMK